MKPMNRRHFLKATGAVMASSMLPFRLASALNPMPGQTLVLVEFSGGNDSLNMVIPAKDPLYYRLRPGLQIARQSQIPWTDSLSLHPALRPLVDHLGSDHWATVLGLGYPAPNRSHFRSIEIWDTASDSDETLSRGWLAQPRSDQYMADAIVLGADPGPVAAADSRTLIMQDLEAFYRKSQSIQPINATADNPALAHLIKTNNDIKSAAEALRARLVLPEFNLPEFGGGAFGRQMREVAQLILLGTAAPVIKVSLGSFDTHQNQRVIHERLLGQFAEALASFYQSLLAAGHWQQVMVMTYSEFGRRVAENGSGGTDHGTAASHFVLGGRVRGGVYGTQPGLDDLDAGDLKFTTDFRRYYQQVKTGFLGDASPVHRNLSQTRGQPLDFIL